MIAERIMRIEVSPTMAVAAKAQKLLREGIDVVDLSVGEPDFPTPENVKEAAIEALKKDFTKYTVNVGMPELREAIARKLKNDNGLDYSPEEIIVSNGAKQSLYNAVLTLVNPGDEVIIPSPYWVSYPNMVKLAEGKVKFLEAKEENGFKITASDLESAITKKTKLFVLCNPVNPTGAKYSRKELEEIAEVVISRNIYVLSDEIYEKLSYGSAGHTSFPSLKKELKEITVLINGVSKAYSMTGWRLGYAASVTDIIKGMAKIQSHSTSNASSISQYAAIAALTDSQDAVERMRREFEKRRDLLHSKINSIRGLSAVLPEGAFYLFVNIKELFGKKYAGKEIVNSLDFSLYLLNEARVAVVPGSAFGTEGYIRISYAASVEMLEKGVERIRAAVEKLT
jgi:aspartate aminotransferase